jgi:DNA-binding transcriptional ArsR family regulator
MRSQVFRGAFANAVVQSPRRALGSNQLTQPAEAIIVSNMVNYYDPLGKTFAALADPTRRAILARLEERSSASTGELAEPFAIKLPAVMKHLDVLGEAGLIERRKSGRIMIVTLKPEPMQAAMDWLRRYERFWNAGLDRLAEYAERKEEEARRADQ